MNEKALKTLEYTKIIDQLTEYASTEMGKQMCRELQPSCDLGTIRQSQTETTDALTRVRMKGSLSFGGVKDVRGSMKRLEIGSSLGIPELLAVSSLLTVAARAQSYGRHEKSEEFPDDSLDERFRALDPLTPVNNEIKRCLPSFTMRDRHKRTLSPCAITVATAAPAALHLNPATKMRSRIMFTTEEKIR